MQVVRTIADCRCAIAGAKQRGRRVYFVPTMGALHAGHVSLIEQARRPVQPPPLLVVSIFVNPTQFGPQEDYARYPRAEEQDFGVCRTSGVDLVFAPDVGEMYAAPDGRAARGGLTSVHVAGLSDGLCGPFRPGHFDGVATVVAKLLLIVQPDAAFFGEKDYQQLAIVRRMVCDLNIPVEIVGCATVREPDGLALSSRNRYLSPVERVQAASLYRGLQAGAAAIFAGERDAERVAARIRDEIEAAGLTRIEYISVVDPAELTPVTRIASAVQLALAVRVGGTRLIDNLRVDPRL